MLPPDRHVHTQWSWDAPLGSMERTCIRAVELGLTSVAFTDHADFTQWVIAGDPSTIPGFIRDHIAGDVLSPPPLDVDGYLACLQECRDKFPSLKILSGVELSEPHWHRDTAADLLRRGNFDLVVCGLHSLRRGHDAFVDVSQGYLDSPPAEVVLEYLTQINGMIASWDNFSALAHIDYPVRFWRERHGTFLAADFEEEYRTVLRTLARSGRALEINTQRPLETDIIRWWHQEGGSAVSFGSDAHDPLKLAHGFADAAAVAQACGFKPAQSSHDFWMRA